MFRAFGIWHSKTNVSSPFVEFLGVYLMFRTTQLLQSLPAVRFHASRLKVKYWRMWRDAMPKALQAKTAREIDQKAVLCRSMSADLWPFSHHLQAKTFNKWMQAYKTKIDLKAVA